MRTRSLHYSFLVRIQKLSERAQEAILRLPIACDDAGRTTIIIDALAQIMFPGRTGIAERMAALLDELEREGFIERYSVDGGQFLRMIDWDQFQKVVNPTASRLPPSPNEPIKNYIILESARELQGRDRNRSTDQTLAEQRAETVSSNVFSDGKSRVVVTTDSVVCELDELGRDAKDGCKHSAAVLAVLKKAYYAGVQPREPQRTVEVDPVDSAQAAAATGDGAGGEAAPFKRPPPNVMHGLPDTSGKA